MNSSSKRDFCVGQANSLPAYAGEERHVTELRESSDIVVAAQHGDANAFGEIVARFQSMAVAIAFGMLGDAHLAQDAAQDAFIDAYLSLGLLREPAAFPGWFRRIVVRHADRQLRYGAREWPLDDLREFVDADDDQPSDALDALYTQARVRDALGGLPHRQRVLTQLFYLDGYSQQEIVDFLDLPLSSVKKGLFQARKRLREEMSDMTTVTPTRSDDLNDKVQFFIALQQHDLARVKTLLAAHPELMDARSEWGVLPNSNYWPLGYTALHWAAATDDVPLLDALLGTVIKLGADVNVHTKNWRATALHIAGMMRRPAVTKRLLAAGANPGETDESGHTPLHLAAYFGDAESARMFIDAGAPLNVKDKGNRTALDWAMLKSHAPVADLLRARGSRSELMQPTRIAPDCNTPIFETGMKIIDFFAPMRRGGVNAIFTPKSGVGKVVNIESLIQVMGDGYGGHSIFLDIERDMLDKRGMVLQFYETGLNDAVTLIFTEDAQPVSMAKAVEAVVEAVQARTSGLLLVADAAFAEHGFQERLRGTVRWQGSDVTLLWHGNYTAGAEPDKFARLDSLITFELWRAKQGLWPSIDPLHSRSTLTMNERHARLQRQAWRLLRRFEDVRDMVERDPRGPGTLETDDDRRDFDRARKLHAFLTQPLAVAEMYTNLLGEYVPLADTLDGVEAILQGQADDIDEGKLRMIGGMDRYFRR